MPENCCAYLGPGEEGEEKPLCPARDPESREDSALWFEPLTCSGWDGGTSPSPSLSLPLALDGPCCWGNTFTQFIHEWFYFCPQSDQQKSSKSLITHVPFYAPHFLCPRASLSSCFEALMRACRGKREELRLCRQLAFSCTGTKTLHST